MKRLILLTLFAGSMANAAPINQVDYGGLTGTQFIDFEDVAGGPEPGTNYDALLMSAGVAFGERFNGQTVVAAGVHDALTGAPAGPLILMAGAPNHNLVIVDTTREAGGNILGGLGTVGYPSPRAVGEGGFAMLFSNDQSQFGFSLVGGDGGSASLSFYRRDGSLIDSLTLTRLRNIDYGFARDGGIKDVAGITIFNNDAGGMGIDNIKHDVVSSVPEPETWAMILAGLGLVGVASRRRQA